MLSASIQVKRMARVIDPNESLRMKSTTSNQSAWLIANCSSVGIRMTRRRASGWIGLPSDWVALLRSWFMSQRQ